MFLMLLKMTDRIKREQWTRSFQAVPCELQLSHGMNCKQTEHSANFLENNQNTILMSKVFICE